MSLPLKPGMCGGGCEYATMRKPGSTPLLSLLNRVLKTNRSMFDMCRVLLSQRGLTQLSFVEWLPILPWQPSRQWQLQGGTSTAPMLPHPPHSLCAVAPPASHTTA